MARLSPPPGALPEQGWAGDWFKTESVAFAVFGPWFRPDMVTMENPFKWDVAMLPKAPATGERATVAYTDMWSIYGKSKYAEQTWEFMKFLTSKEGQEMWVDLIGSRSISPVKEVAQSADWINYGGSSGQFILDELQFARVPPVNFANANEVETIWNMEFGSVIAGEQDVEVAAQKACEQIQSVLDNSQ